MEEERRPGLSLIYLPHLDYNLQRLGPGDPRIADDLRRIDRIVGDLVDFLESREVAPVLISEYGIVPVDRPVHINRHLRRKGWIAVREELGRELLDCGQSRAFGVSDHQVCHIYVRDPGLLGRVRGEVEGLEGVERVLDADGQEEAGIAHRRCGDLVAVARPGSWFTYYYWLDDRRAPDFARCVDIHRKPGYDPAELFLDPALRLPRLRILRRLVQKRLGFRMLMDVVPLDASLVGGSHGRCPEDPLDWPVWIGPGGGGPVLDSTEVSGAVERLVLEEDPTH